jgi:ssRNA-specific RNase YbeY (16S rRNA maturation enzyme)
MVVNLQRELAVNTADARAFVRKLTATFRIQGWPFNVCFVNDSGIQQLNTEFRGRPAPTDVLSFPWTLGEASLQIDEPGPLTRRFAPPSPQGRGLYSTSSSYLLPYRRALCSISSSCPLPGREGGPRPGEGFGKRHSKSQILGSRSGVVSGRKGRHGRWEDEFAGFLGDIAISTETAHRNAALAGRSTVHEIRRLILHGLLHLLGYDHETDHGEMDRLELSLRGRLGIDGLEDKSKIKRQKDKTRKVKGKAKPAAQATTDATTAA